MGTFADPIVAAFVAKLPATKEDGQGVGFDGHAFLADFLVASATAQAERVYLGFSGFMASGNRTPEELATYIEARGLAVLEAWADLMTCAKQDREVWAREAANRAALAYRDRLCDLMENAGQGRAA